MSLNNLIYAVVSVVLTIVVFLMIHAIFTKQSIKESAIEIFSKIEKFAEGYNG